LQPVLDGAFLSIPGVFGWNKVDQGSSLLIDCIKDMGLSGTGADFGCGYGYLSKKIMQQSPGPEKLFMIDADFRAIVSAQANFKNEKNIEFIWADLTKNKAVSGPLDWVIMNPPFHEGKNVRHSIGAHFIRTASISLKKGGALLMVANSHLPYENELEEQFTDVDKLTEEKGFKVFHATQ
jgi:16S rRNA (guanine1207-N2)-methyltransferase